MGRTTSKGNEGKSKMKHPSDRPTPRFELGLDHHRTPYRLITTTEKQTEEIVPTRKANISFHKAEDNAQV